METFKQLVNNDLENLNDKKIQNNLNREEKEILKNLTNNKNIVIKPADKGGGIVVMDTIKYKLEIERQLSDSETYNKLKGDPTAKIEQDLFHLVDCAFGDGILNKKEKDFLKIQHPRIPVIYTLPKIHKDLQNPPDEKSNLATWRCYIDDCIIIWRGSEGSLKEFIEGLNINNFNLKFTYDYSRESVNFLELNIYATTDGLCTRLFKKKTDCNGYIPYNSGHHRKWLNNIPKGQFGRIKRNCSNLDDYRQNCEIMEGDFREKGYNTQLLQDSRKEIDKIDRKELLVTRKKEKTLQFVPFVTKFSKGGYKLSNIMRKHWHILKMDNTLQGIIGDHPSIIFTRPNTLRQSLAPSYLKMEKNKPTWLGNNKGFYKCMQCVTCKTLGNPERQIHNFKSNQTNKQYKINQLITCETTNVVLYICWNVRRTTRKLKLRLGEHIRNIKKGLKTHSVSDHFLQYHNSDPSGLKAIGISNKTKSWRGGDNVQIISQEETRWIITLKTLQPCGLNIDLDINCFI
ncbi:hypothetical protein XELAEV_18033295mg [Xenopus laevis]|uniref:Helix-turn-helix domain-containing protein n=1 Tax=Xenopus laevis TaxID=8355 RepID=A0A974HDV2_XENLA|nr:hypothetical protein XELAEV_18033295mg [Xenopus laevis]